MESIPQTRLKNMRQSPFNIRTYKFCKYGTDSITKMSISPIFHAVNLFFNFLLNIHESHSNDTDYHAFSKQCP